MFAWNRLTNTSFVKQIIDHLRVPLYRNGYALVFNSAATSGLGMVYWILAARNYSTVAIGVNSAAISAILFLANLSQLNLVNALNRFIPATGRATTRLVVYAYLISVVVALFASLFFIVGANVWAPALNFSQAGPMFMVWFTVATMAWCIFLLQDSVLTGLRQAHWVPIENLVFSVAKIVLLVALADSVPFYGVLASWTLPLALSIVPVNLLISRRLIPRHVQATENQTPPITNLRSQIAAYVAGDYMSTLIWMASTSLLPLIILQRAGATATAYYYLCSTLAYSLYLVSQNMGMSLVAEAATDPTQINRYAYRTFVQSARLVVPGAAVIIVGAPLILGLFGANYAEAGTPLLRLLSLSAIPYIVNAIFVSIARVRRKMRSIFIMLTIMSALTLVLTIVWLDAAGIVGIGWAWLISQTTVAVLVIATRFRRVWLTQIEWGLLRRLLQGPRH